MKNQNQIFQRLERLKLPGINSKIIKRWCD